MDIKEKRSRKIPAALLLTVSIGCFVLAAFISPVSAVCTALAALAGIVSNPLLLSVLKKSKAKHSGIKCFIVFVILAGLLVWLIPKEIETDRRIREGQPKQTQSEKEELQPVAEEGLDIYFLDCGQSDCTVIICDGCAMLFDCASDNMGTKIRGQLYKLGIRSLDTIIISHFDEDHCGSADSLITHFLPKTVIYPKQTKDTAACRDTLDAMRYTLRSVDYPVVGKKYSLGSAEYVILGPSKDSYEDINDSSVALLLTYGEKRFLFTGDAEAESEGEILLAAEKTGTDIKNVDVYQVGHHGSNSSTTEPFLDVIQPRFAVISCGDGNDYGHPHKVTLEALKTANTAIYRTDKQGTVSLHCDGKNITWSTQPTDDYTPGTYKGEQH